LIIFLFSGRKPLTLIGVGTLFYLIGNGFYFLLGFTIPRLPAEDLAETLQTWTPTAEMIAEELAIYRGSWLDQLPARSSAALGLETLLFLVNGFWRVGGLMLMGMAFYKYGVLQGKMNRRFYVSGAVIGISVGIGCAIFGVMQIESHDWKMMYTQFFGFQYNWIAAPLTAFGYLCLTNLWCQGNALQWLKVGIQATGRMSLSNYLTQTILCTTFFYGHGFAWYGHLSRFQLVFITLLIWSLQISVSYLWLQRYHYGPAEWVWRSLSRWELPKWKIQPGMDRVEINREEKERLE